MSSPTSSEDSWFIVRIVPCAQTRLPGPRGHRNAFSSAWARASSASAARFDRPAQQATEPGLSKARGDVCYLSWLGGRFDVLTWPAVRGVVFICACIVLTGNRLYNSMLLVVFSHINIPWLWHQTYLCTILMSHEYYPHVTLSVHLHPSPCFIVIPPYKEHLLYSRYQSVSLSNKVCYFIEELAMHCRNPVEDELQNLFSIIIHIIIFIVCFLQ